MAVNAIVQKLNQIKIILDQNKLANIGADYMRNITPIRSGYAKDHTRAEGNNIHADYQYADVLDQGRYMSNRGMRGSDQAPNGLTKPTIEFLDNYVKQSILNNNTTPTNAPTSPGALTNKSPNTPNKKGHQFKSKGKK